MKLGLSKKYKNKRAFITGAASGLGKAFAELLYQDGWTLGLADNQMEELDKLKQKFGNDNSRIRFYFLDVSQPKDYEIVTQNYLIYAGGIDLLINNAGVGEGSPFEEYTIENWNWVISVNQMGVLHGCHYFIPSFINQKSGHIVNIASAAAFANLPGMSPYNVSKAAVLSLSETLFAEYKSNGLGVSVVMPTFFKTNIVEKARGTEESKEMARLLIANSGLEADEVALRILKAVARNKFYIILPAKSWILWSLKRLFPRMVLSLNAWIHKNQNYFKERMKKRK